MKAVTGSDVDFICLTLQLENHYVETQEELLCVCYEINQILPILLITMVCCRIALDYISFERDIQLIHIWFPHQMFTLKATQLKSTMLPSGATAQTFSLSQQIYRFQFAEPKIPYPLGNWRFNLHRTLSEPDWVSLA